MAPPIYLLFKQYSVEVKRWLSEIFHIPRLDSTKAAVKIVYATPERAIAKYIAPLRNKQTDIPIIGFYLAGMAYSPEKNVTVENLETIYDQDNNIVRRLKPLQVYTLTYVINIWTRLQMDMDIVLYQLLTQFTPHRWLAVDSNVNYNDYVYNTAMTDGPEQGKTPDPDGGFERKVGQWFPLYQDSVTDASALEPGEAGDRLIRTDINLACDRAYLPIGGFEYSPVLELNIHAHGMNESQFSTLMTDDSDWLASVTAYDDLPDTDSPDSIRLVTEEDEPYVAKVDNVHLYQPTVDSLAELPLTGNISSDIRYVNNKSDFYRWSAFASEWQRYNGWIELRHYLKDKTIIVT